MADKTYSILSNQVLAARFWCACFVITLVVFSALLWRMSVAFDRNFQVLVVDQTGFYFSKTLDFTAASYLHESQVRSAVETLFNRGPVGIDNPERLKRLFEEPARVTAAKLIFADAEEFRAKAIHQKVEIAEVKLVQVKDESVIATFTGQVIRTGMFGGRPIVEALAVSGRITFARNPDIVANGAFPTLVREFETEIHTSSTQ